MYSFRRETILNPNVLIFAFDRYLDIGYLPQIASAKTSRVSNFHPFSYHEEPYETNSKSLQHIYYTICWLKYGDCHKSSVRLLWLKI